MEFVLWHSLLIVAIMVGCFVAGYVTAGAVKKLLARLP